MKTDGEGVKAFGYRTVRGGFTIPMKCSFDKEPGCQ